MTIHRALTILGTLSLLVAASVFAQQVDQDMDDEGEDGGGCVSNRQVYPEDTELCQEGSLVRCKAGSWGAVGVCKERPGPEPVSEGGDVVDDSED